MRERRCQVCGSKPAIPVVYGYPTDDSMERAARGEIALGGCVIDEGAPHYLCRSCASGGEPPGDPGEDETLR